VVKKKPYNSGDAYEEKLFDALKAKLVLAPGTRRSGAGEGPDLQFSHRTRVYNLEAKLDLHADYGQKMLRWSLTEGWNWCKEDQSTELYDKLGVLPYLNSKGLIPNKHRKENPALTVADKKQDQAMFEDNSLHVDINSLRTFYKGKNVFYLQIGSGFGFYCLADDPAKLGVPQFNAEFTLRFRAKTINSTPVHNYGFYAVLKVRPNPKPEKSAFNIEAEYERKFPPFSP
jgi:hypothetical protein